MTIRLTLAALLALPAGTALADNHLSGPSYQAVTEFFAPLGEEAEEMAASGGMHVLTRWMSDRTQDEAPFFFTGDVVLSDGPTARFEMTLTGADLEDFGQMAQGGQMGMMDNVLSDYSLDVVTNAAWGLPDGGIAGEVAFYETGSLEFPEGAAPIEPGPFSSATVCSIRLTPGPERMIQMANCDVTTNI
jgi:hypothetical protein